METKLNIRLTSAEMGTLWTTYMNDTMAKCVLRYFLNKVEDTEVKSVIIFALDISERHIQVLSDLFGSEDFPVPKGFTDADVNINAKRLFSDSFIMYYLKNMSKVGLSTYAMAYTMASRADIRTFFLGCLGETEQLDERATEVMQSKGIYVRPPYISAPDQIDFVTNQSFLWGGGFFGFGDKRPLLAMEIGQLFANVQTNALGKALLMGFSQVVQSNEVRQYLLRGKEISDKHLRIFTESMISEDIPAPMSWDTDVMATTEAPFTDKLILFHVSLLVAAGTANYAISTAASPRSDIAATYVRLAAEIATYTVDGAKLMIANGWLEEPPQAPDRKQLSKV